MRSLDFPTGRDETEAGESGLGGWGVLVVVVFGGGGIGDEEGGRKGRTRKIKRAYFLLCYDGKVGFCTHTQTFCETAIVG